MVEDASRYRVELKKGLHFSDGSVLDAHDVVATFRALVDPQVRSRYASTYRRIRKVRAISDHEALFELDSPHATFVTDLEMPILRAEDAARPATSAGLPVGAGPYQLSAHTRGELLLTQNPYALEKELPFAKLRFVVVHDDNTRALRMLAGAGDLALNVISPLLVPLFQRPDFEVRSAPGVGTTYVGFNLENRVLSDVRVRQALAYGLNRTAIIEHKLGGRARLASSWIVPGHWAHADDTPSYTHDVERARQLLRDALGTRRLSLTIRTGSDRFTVSIARALAAMWLELGVDVDVRPSESATLLADLARGRFEIVLMQVPEVFEPHVLSWFFASERIPQVGVREGGNRFRMRNHALDAAFEAGRVTVERKERARIYREVQHLLARELPVIPLWHEDVVAVTSRKLDGYRVPRDSRFGTLAMPLSRVH